jgi:hypothetical protein
MKSISCKQCGSDDVYCSRISYWSKDRGAWIDEEFSDEYGCNACGGSEMEIADVPEDPVLDTRGEDMVCMHYIIDQLAGIRHDRAVRLREELLHNLGVSRHNRWKGGDM